MKRSIITTDGNGNIIMPTDIGAKMCIRDRDYSEHGLGELLALYGSAYNVNIKIFNDIQHTITGLPGGKPNADDSNRPERANPYPKKVIVFSPHPDDDVISMGGTLRRLCDQHHDVHVAYETSGNIAVGDEEVIRYCEYLRCLLYTSCPKKRTFRCDGSMDRTDNGVGRAEYAGFMKRLLVSERLLI